MTDELRLILSELEKPFDTVKWKVQTCNKSFALCVAYIDARDVQKRLDEVCAWQDRYKDLGNGRVFSEIGILVDREWMWRSDTGSAGTIEKDKSEASDAFKRAAVKWGVGRYLYELDVFAFRQTAVGGKNKKGEDMYYPANEKDGKPIKTGTQLSDYINKRRGDKTRLQVLLGTELEGVKTMDDYLKLTKSLAPIFERGKKMLNA